MEIYTPKKDEITIELIKSFQFSSRGFLPYTEHNIPADYLLNYVASDIRDSLDRSAIALLAKKKEHVLGLLVCERAEWDSKHFGEEIAKINYLATLGDSHEKRHCAKEMLSHLFSVSEFRLWMTRTHTEDIPLFHALEDCSFQLMDTLVTYSFDFEKNEMCNFKKTCKIRPWEIREIPELVRIAKTSFSEKRVAVDHFHADPRLNEAKSDALFEHWIEDACEKDDMVLVAEIDDQPVGFTTCRVHHHLNSFLNRKIGAMILSAVSPEHRHREIYTSMIHAGLRWLSEKVDIIELGTQVGNYPVQKAWSKLNFKIARSQYTWHKWIL